MASSAFSNSRYPYTKYIVDGTGNYARFITQPEEGANNDIKIVNSMFLGVKTAQQNVSNPPTILILKPRSLWLSLNGSEVVDVHGKSGNDIVNYSPKYENGKEVKINYLSYPIPTSDLLSGSALDNINSLLGDGPKFIFVEDINSANRARIAAPNLAPSNYDSFSRWL